EALFVPGKSVIRSKCREAASNRLRTRSFLRACATLRPRGFFQTPVGFSVSLQPGAVEIRPARSTSRNSKKRSQPSALSRCAEPDGRGLVSDWSANRKLPRLGRSVTISQHLVRKSNTDEMRVCE